MIRETWLGVRLAGAGGRTGLFRMVLMATGSAAAAVVLLTTFGLARVVDGQDARAQHIAPRVVPSAEGEASNASIIADGWDRRELRRIVLASDLADTPTPPGLKRPPRNSEVSMSPALARLAESEPLIAERFPQTRGPQVASDGLISPDQLLAYIGAPADRLGPYSVRIDSFGDPSASSRLDPRVARTVGMLVTLLLIAPVIMFMVVCARLSANSRTQRLAALRLLGLSRRRTQVVNAAEIGISATAGSLAGWSLWTLWLKVQPEARIGVFTWYSTDIALPAAEQVAIICALIIMSVAVAAMASRDAIANPSRTRRDRSSRHISLWRLVPLLAGAVLLVVARLRAGGTSVDFKAWTPLFGAGLTITAIGLVIAAPFASTLVGQLMMRSPRPPLLIAGSRLRHDPSATSRVVAALSVALFAAGVAQIVATSLDTLDDEFTPTIPAVVNLGIIGPPTTATTYQPLSPLTNPLAVYRIGPPDHQIDAVAATCDQLRVATNQALPTCTDGQIQRVDDNGPKNMAGPGSIDRIELDHALRYSQLPPTADIPLDLTISFVDGSFTPSVLVPPELAPATATSFYIPIPADQYDPQTLTAALAQQSPTAFWNPLITQVDRLDTPRLYRGLIAAGTTAALIIGAAALAIATIADAIEHRKRLRSLDAIGASPATIRSSIILQTAPTSLILLAVASTTAIIGGDAYLRFGYENAAFPFAALGELIAFAIAATIIASLLAAGAVTHLNHHEIVRQE